MCHSSPPGERTSATKTAAPVPHRPRSDRAVPQSRRCFPDLGRVGFPDDRIGAVTAHRCRPVSTKQRGDPSGGPPGLEAGEFDGIAVYPSRITARFERHLVCHRAGGQGHPDTDHRSDIPGHLERVSRGTPSGRRRSRSPGTDRCSCVVKGRARDGQDRGGPHRCRGQAPGRSRPALGLRGVRSTVRSWNSRGGVCRFKGQAAARVPRFSWWRAAGVA